MKTGNDFLDQVRRIEFGLVPLFLTLVSIDSFLRWLASIEAAMFIIVLLPVCRPSS